MPQRPACLPELAALLSALCEEAITDAQFARLDELLESDPDARRYYAVYIDMHAGLSRRFGLAEPSLRRALDGHAGWLGKPRRWALAATALALVGLALALTRLSRGEPREAAADPEPTTDRVAVLQLAADAVWEAGSPAPAVAAPLAPGWLRLKSGSIVVQFFHGATVIVDGPAEFQVVSADQAFCRRGRCSAEVPPQAIGFRIAAPQVTVVDLGTAFGLEVQPDRAEVHVLQGEVAVEALPTVVPNLKAGEAIGVARDGRIEHLLARQAPFVSARELERRVAATLRQHYADWRAAGPQRNGSPDLLARFDFEKDSLRGQNLLNVASDPSVPQGTVVGCGAVDGRWPGKGALEFRTLSDRVRVRVPGEYRSVTFTAWVRVDALDRAFNSLFMCEGYGRGGIHWQIGHHGELRLGVKGDHQRATDYCSPVVFGPERIGQWLHLAVAYDADAQRVTHFVDGTAVSREPLRFDVPLRIGNADIGNWSVGSHSSIYPIRCFTGRMDELALYGRALADREIAEIYALGTLKPPPTH